MDKNLSPIHPGEILLEDFMKPLGLTQYRLAQDLGVTPIRISQIAFTGSL
jgi:addiction module HigA family antidote